MKKEQGKAIERLQYLRDDIRRNKIKAYELISEEGKYNLADDIETVLNMLKEKDKEIENLQKEIEHQKEKRENQKEELAILNEKQKEMNKLINDVKSYKGQFKRQEKVIREKDKQIDLLLK